MTEQYMTISEVARMLRLSGRSVRRWIQAGILPATRLPGRGGGEFRVPRAAVVDLLERGSEWHGPDVIGQGRKCEGVTASGEPCRGLAMRGSRFCRHHQDQEQSHENATP